MNDRSTSIEMMDRYWRAANYLSVGQIYLMDNPLLREPLRAEHVKPRLLGHWGHHAGSQFHLRPLKQADQGSRSGCALRLRAGTWRTRNGRKHLA